MKAQRTHDECLVVLAIDPGYEQSAIVTLSARSVSAKTVANREVLQELRTSEHRKVKSSRLVIEQIESFGMPVGREVFETVFWSGRFAEAWGRSNFDRISRREVKLHLCGSARAKDANVRQALIDRFGPGKDKAVGIVKAKGPLYGIVGDQWAALAVAVTWWNSHANRSVRNAEEEVGEEAEAGSRVAAAEDGRP